MKELVILLPGNTYIGPIADDQVASVSKFIDDAVEKQQAVWLTLTDSRAAKIRIAAITGYYFRERTETPAEKLIKKQTDLVETVSAQIKRAEEGESWKGGDD